MEQQTLKFILPNRYPSECLITICRQSGIVVVTYIDKGMSRSAGAVTNTCEQIANTVVQQFDANPQRIIFIEQYRPGRPDQTTDLVQFNFVDGKALRHPRWTRIPAEDFNRMIGIAEET